MRACGCINIKSEFDSLEMLVGWSLVFRGGGEVSIVVRVVLEAMNVLHYSCALYITCFQTLGCMTSNV